MEEQAIWQALRDMRGGVCHAKNMEVQCGRDHAGHAEDLGEQCQNDSNRCRKDSRFN